MKIFSHIFLFLSTFFFLINANDAWAGPFRITVTNYGNVPTASHADINTLFSNLETEVNSKLPTADTTSYPPAMANSQAIALKGLGTDYATNPSIFIVGFGVGIAADTGGYNFSEVTSSKIEAKNFKGIGAQTSLMGGINLKYFDSMPTLFDVIDLKKMTAFINFMKVKLPSVKKGITGDLSSYGFHIQYKIYNGYSAPLFFKWGGIDITTGFDHGSSNLKLSQDYAISKTRDVTDPTGVTRSLDANFTGNASIESNVSINTIPLELSTNVQLLYVLTLFGGIGVDFNSGSSKITAVSTGPIAVNDTTNTLTGITANAALNLGDDGKPKSMFSRYFLGTQVNIWAVKMYAQLNHAFGGNLWGLNLGVRVAF
ncbi:MAG: hypothetical protein HQK51_02105 [Oligoflexia bacterium]|nr:hypothetical protein [Oligoflexia bacterium]